jgi:sigma-B regulation protein RsbU (phosphoserine phosphatase)
VVADVAGHGLAAGLRMAMVKSALALLVEDDVEPERIFARLHRLLKNRPGERSFVTATLARFDPADGRLELTNAGHPPTYLVRASGAVEELELPGTPLGSLPGRPGSATATLAPGDAALWLSDGLIEARSAAGELFGYDRVRRCLAGPPLTDYGLRDRLLAAVRAHTGGAPAEDDRTVVVLLYRGAASSRPSSE